MKKIQTYHSQVVFSCLYNRQIAWLGDRQRRQDDGKKAPDKGAGTLQSKAAANAFKLAKEVVGGPGTMLARLKALRRENADDDLWSLLRSINPDSADLAAPDAGGSSGVARSAARCSRTTPGPPMPSPRRTGRSTARTCPRRSSWQAGSPSVSFTIRCSRFIISKLPASRAFPAPRPGPPTGWAAQSWRLARQGGAALFRGGREPVLHLLWRACAPGGSAEQRLRVPGSRRAFATRD